MVRLSLQFMAFILAFAMLAVAQAQSGSLVSLVDRSTIAEDETLKLTVRFSGPQGQGAPDFTQLEAQFDIISTSKSNQFRSVNGQVTAYTDWIMVLGPKATGKALIPSFRLGSSISDALEITVLKAAAAPTGAINDVFLETLVDKDQGYVQEQFIVTYRLFYTVNIESLENDPLELSDVLLEQLPDERYNRVIENRIYRIAEFKFALFPQTSGELVIPSLRWNVNIQKSGRSVFGFSGRVEVKRLRTKELTLTVKPRPDAFPPNQPWLPAKNLQLNEKWSADPAQFTAGEPITRQITLQAQGLMATQLPKIWDEIDNDIVKTYADQASLKDDKKTDGISGERVESAAVVMSSGGNISLPAIRIPWWDIESDSVKYAALPARQLQAQGPAPATAASFEKPITANNDVTSMNAPGQSNGTAAHVWQGISAAFFVLWIVTCFRWWQLHHKRSKPNSSSAATGENATYKALQQIIASGSSTQIRAAIIPWARDHWGPKASTLAQIQWLCDDEDLSEQLQALDEGLYGKSDGKNLDRERLSKTIKGIHTLKNAPSSDKNGLPEFHAAH